jgi:ribosomal protein L7Ae-like RNA K-turn-binding protein
MEADWRAAERRVVRAPPPPPPQRQQQEQQRRRLPPPPPQQQQQQQQQQQRQQQRQQQQRTATRRAEPLAAGASGGVDAEARASARAAAFAQLDAHAARAARSALTSSVWLPAPAPEPAPAPAPGPEPAHAPAASAATPAAVRSRGRRNNAVLPDSGDGKSGWSPTPAVGLSAFIGSALARKIKDKERSEKALDAERSRAAAAPRALDKKASQGRVAGSDAAPSRGGKSRRSSAAPKKKRKTPLKKSVLRSRAHRWYLLHPSLQPVPLQVHPAMAGYVGVLLAPQVVSEAAEEEQAEEAQGTVEDVLDHPASALDSSSSSAEQRESGGEEGTAEAQLQQEERGVAAEEAAESEAAGRSSGLVSESDSESDSGDSEVDSQVGSGAGCGSESEPAPDAPLVRELVNAVSDEQNWDPRLLSPVFWGCSVAPEGAVGGVPLVGATGAPTAGPNSARLRLRETRPVREYVAQALSSELDAAVFAMLSRLMELQERLRLKDAAKSKMRRRLVFGLREVLRGVRTRRCKCVVIAPNLELGAAGLVHTGLDATVQELLLRCAPTPEEREQGQDGVPVVFALSARKLGHALGKSLKMSAVGLYSADGAFHEFKEVLRRTARLRALWERAVAQEQLAAPPQRALLALCAECHAYCGTVRHDCEACGVTRCTRCAASALARGLSCPNKPNQPSVPCAILRIARNVPADDELRARQRSDELLRGSKRQGRLLQGDSNNPTGGQTGDHQAKEKAATPSRVPEGQGQGVAHAKQTAIKQEERDESGKAAATSTLATRALAGITPSGSALATSTLSDSKQASRPLNPAAPIFHARP